MLKQRLKERQKHSKSLIAGTCLAHERLPTVFPSLVRKAWHEIAAFRHPVIGYMMREINLQMAWLAILLGLITGAGIGLFFHRETGWAATVRGGADDSTRTYFVFRHGIPESGVRPVRAASGSRACSVGRIHGFRGRCPHHADGLFLVRVAHWVPTPFFIPVASSDRGLGRFPFPGSPPMKIGLIAMSGVRACDPELVRLGMTLPGFVERGRTIASLPSLGLLTLAGMTPPQHKCEYLEVKDIHELDTLPDRFDLVAISSLSAQIGEAYELADRYRELGVPVVMGGLHVTALPDEAARHASGGHRGRGRIGLAGRGAGCRDGDAEAMLSCGGDFSLADAPMPAYDMLDPSKYNRLIVQTSRGCPLRCEFCASSILLTRRYKQKPIDKVLAEIDRIRALWRRPFIEFADDNAFVNRRYWKELLPELKTRKIRWFAETDLSVQEDSELLRLMRESGCAEVLIGFESPGDLGTARPRAQERLEAEAMARIERGGRADSILWNSCEWLLHPRARRPGAGIFDRVLEFAMETGMFDVQITVQTPFPGTPLYARLKREGRLLRETPGKHVRSSTSIFARSRCRRRN